MAGRDWKPGSRHYPKLAVKRQNTPGIDLGLGGAEVCRDGGVT